MSSIILPVTSPITSPANKIFFEEAQVHINNLQNKILELDVNTGNFHQNIDYLIAINKLLQDSAVNANFWGANSPLVEVSHHFESSVNLLRDRYFNNDVDLIARRLFCEVIKMMEQIIHEYCTGIKTKLDWIDLQNNLFNHLNQYLMTNTSKIETLATEDKINKPFNEPFNLDDTSEALHLFDLDFDMDCDVTPDYQSHSTKKNLLNNLSNLDNLDYLDGFLLIQIDDEESSQSHESFESSLQSPLKSSNDELTTLFPSLLSSLLIDDSAEESDLLLDTFIESNEELKLPMPELLIKIFSDSSAEQLLDTQILVNSDDETELQGVNWNDQNGLVAIENLSEEDDDDFKDDWTKLVLPEFLDEINNIETSVLADLEASFDQINFDMPNDDQDFGEYGLNQLLEQSKNLEQSADDDMFWDLSESIGNLETSMFAVDQFSDIDLSNLDTSLNLSQTLQDVFQDTLQDQDYPTSDVDTAIEESPIYQNNNTDTFQSFWEDVTLTNSNDKEAFYPALNLNMAKVNASSNDATIRIPLNHLELLKDLSEELLIRKGSLDVYLSEVRMLTEAAHKSLNLHDFDRLTHVLSLAEQQTDVMSQDVQHLQKLFHQALKYPVSSIVKQFPRLLHDLCLQYDKKVNLIVQGAEVGIERALSGIISESLELLLRSACEHRIESPSERQHQGKELQGKIEIIASQTDDSTTIKIIDDGCGFENLSTSISYSQSDVMLSAIKKKLWEVEGTISVESQIGKGTEFTIVLPNTLTLMRVLLINIDQMRLAIPSKSILEVLPMQANNNIKDEQKTLLWRDRVIPIIRINTFLKLNCRQISRQSTDQLERDKSAGTTPSFVVIQQENELFALATDGCWNDQEVTFHQIEGDITLPKIFDGAVILGSNQAVTLLNLSELVDQCLTSKSNNIGLSSQSDHQDLDNLSDLSSFFGRNDQKDQSCESNNSNSVNQTVRWLGRSPESKILIVESSANVRRYLAMTLSRSGFLTEQVQNGKEAIAFLHKRLQMGLDIDVVITDLEMPQMEGFKFLTDIRADADLQGLPIVVLTARNNENDQKLALDLGANAYFSKPYREEELVKTLQQIVAR